ncbi:MAG: hypothetical protein UMU75_09870 [Halomonas sp.]|nr:hypothetical protein [Halomonas sp.]
MAAVGLVIVLGLSGFMFWQAVVGESSLPNIAVQPVRMVENGSSHLVELNVTNLGGRTAAGVTIKGELLHDGEVIETSRVTISFVPPHSEAIAGLYFDHAPRKETLRLSAEGYHQP